MFHHFQILFRDIIYIVCWHVHVQIHIAIGITRLVSLGFCWVEKGVLLWPKKGSCYQLLASLPQVWPTRKLWMSRVCLSDNRPCPPGTIGMMADRCVHEFYTCSPPTLPNRLCSISDRFQGPRMLAILCRHCLHSLRMCLTSKCTLWLHYDHV